MQSPMADHDIFREQVATIYRSYGHALWDPRSWKPDMRVEVGDVGFIRRGKFHHIFNILRPKSEQIDVPDNYEQLVLKSSPPTSWGSLAPGHYYSAGITMEHVSEMQTRNPDISQVTFKCPGRREGAVLSLPVEARSEDALAPVDFGEWIVKHIDCCLEYARQHGLGIERMEDIVLVTGCHRTKSWMNVAFLGRHLDAKVSFGTDIDAQVKFHISPGDVQGPVYKKGPEGTNLSEDQCIFIRGYRVARTRWFSRRRLRAEGGPSPDPEGYDSEPDTELISIPEISKYRDPLHVLIDYIAEQAHDCDMVLVHDDDLKSIDGIGECNSLESLKPEALMDLLRKSNIEVHKVRCDSLAASSDPKCDTGPIWVATISDLSRDWNNALLSELPAPAPRIRDDTSHSQRIRDLAIAQLQISCYLSPKQQDDLEQSILYFTEAILQPLPWDGCLLNIVQTFYFLTLTLFVRAKEFKQPVDVKSCITYLRYFEHQSPGVYGLTPDHTTVFLVQALVIKVQLDLGDVMGDIEEIADRCRKLLNSDISMNFQRSSVSALAGVVDVRFGSRSKGQGPPEKVIQCLRETIICLPDLHKASIALADLLLNRFNVAYSTDDYEEGIAILDKVVALRTPGDKPSPYQKIALALAAKFALIRLSAFGTQGNLVEAIYRIRKLLGGIPPDNPLCLVLSQMLSNFRVHSSHSRYLGKPSFSGLTASLPKTDAVTLSEAKDIIFTLLPTIHLKDIAEVEDGINYCRQLLVSHPSSESAPLASAALANYLIRAFSLTSQIEYIDEAILIIRDYHKIPGVQMFHFYTILILISSLSTRFEWRQRGEDLHELMELFPMAANDIHAGIFDQFQLSCHWARLARTSQHPSTIIAYDCAISFMQGSLLFAPTLDIKHFRLVAGRNNYERLPLDYASYCIHRGQLEKAIETLERGRALIWSEIRSFRTSIDRICAADPDLADKFAAVNRELEMSVLAINLVDGDDGGPKVMDPFQGGHVAVRKQRFLDARETLISQIQTLPGFEAFLNTLSFDTLRSAALRGPVIIINHCEWRSDIIILTYNSPPSLISTTDDFYCRANELREKLFGARKKGLESKEYENALASVLKELYELVGRPVIQRLNDLRVPEQSRVWWCPTSVFCSLPLHAMGPIPSDVGPPRYFLDLYIPSYTPTLSALIESNKPSSETLERPTILLVLQPDEYMKEALDEMRVVQAVNTRMTALTSARATPTAVLERLRDHRFAHIACHGILETDKSFNASFKLHGDERLSLLDIVRSRLPNAEFAFLSACHAAELTEEGPADEGLHLVAVMQNCGFRSVVGTTWAMADTDGRELARNFYKSVFSGKTRRQGVHHYERTAEALRDAVRKLRRKRGITLERWVNFVHYGA